MQLLLPSAKSAVLVVEEKPRLREYAQKALVVIGIVVVGLGAFDLLSKIPQGEAERQMGRDAFAPAVLIIE